MQNWFWKTEPNTNFHHKWSKDSEAEIDRQWHWTKFLSWECHLLENYNFVWQIIINMRKLLHLYNPPPPQHICTTKSLRLFPQLNWYVTKKVTRTKKTSKMDGRSLWQISISFICDFFPLYPRSPYPSFQRNNNDWNIIVVTTPIPLWDFKQLMEVHT